MPAIEVYLLTLLHVAPASWSVYHILLYKRDSRAALGWIIVCLFIPFAGPVAYFFFGINRIRSRARNIKRSFLSIEYEAGGQKPKIAESAETGLKAIGARITGRTVTFGNTVTPLYNGERVYPAMIDAINRAQSRVLLATYILNTDRVGSSFADALASAVGRGVEVLVLVDGVGEMYSWRRASKVLRKRGVNAARFLPPRLFPPSIYLNLRNHRKLLIVDRDMAFAGGINISDANVASDERPRKVSDVHFELHGPIVNSLAEIFYRDWCFTTGEAFQNDEPGEPVAGGGEECRAIPDGPDGELDALALTIQSVVSSASENIEIMTPYFLPSRELIAALQAAVLRGVTVRVVLPGKNNLFYVHWANRNMLTELLRWGVEAYYQPAPFCHSKILCVDQEYSLIGSANLDPRSLRLNYELGIEVFSVQLSKELRSHFEAVIAESALIKYEQLVSRSVPVRLRDSAVALFSPYLECCFRSISAEPLRDWRARMRSMDSSHHCRLALTFIRPICNVSCG